MIVMMMILMLAPMIVVFAVMMMFVLIVLAPMIVVVMRFAPMIAAVMMIVMMMTAVGSGHHVRVLFVCVRSVVDGVRSVRVPSARFVCLDHRTKAVLVGHIVHDTHATVLVMQAVRSFASPSVAAFFAKVGSTCSECGPCSRHDQFYPLKFDAGIFRQHETHLFCP